MIHYSKGRVPQDTGQLLDSIGRAFAPRKQGLSQHFG